MDIQKLSSSYAVKVLTAQDVDTIYELTADNPLFYHYCPPFVTKESILQDMQALPPRKTYEDKYYLGFWEQEKLVAVLDLITHFPNEKTAFFGFFMMNSAVQQQGIGSRIVSECAAALKTLGFSYIRLGFAKGNPQSEHFWRKNGFAETSIETENVGYTVVILQKVL